MKENKICKICGLEFGNKTILECHYSLVHPVKEPEFQEIPESQEVSSTEFEKLSTTEFEKLSTIELEKLSIPELENLPTNELE